jgi:predicted metalloprotease with PDZ domain
MYVSTHLACFIFVIRLWCWLLFFFPFCVFLLKKFASAGLALTESLRVVGVAPGSPAHRARIPAGARVVAVKSILYFLLYL